MDDKTAKLEEVKKTILETTLPLQDTATNLVFGKGNPEAPILFIGEAPGRNEDLEGYPFVGAAGKQLDKLLSLIDLGLDDVYIANILKYRPPKNRDPNVDEIKAHTPFLIEQIKAIKPAIIATLGNYATKFVLAGFEPDSMKQIEGITKLHGVNKGISINDEKFVVIPLYHPAAMLYRPQLREVIEKDISKMGDYLDRNHPTIQRRKKDSQTQLKF